MRKRPTSQSTPADRKSAFRYSGPQQFVFGGEPIINIVSMRTATLHEEFVRALRDLLDWNCPSLCINLHLICLTPTALASP